MKIIKDGEKIEKIRKDNDWNCPYQTVRFIGYKEDGSENYLMSQIREGIFTQWIVNYNFSK